MKADTAWLLHGAAGSPRVWDRVIAKLPVGMTGIAVRFDCEALDSPSCPHVLVGNGVGSIHAARFAHALIEGGIVAERIVGVVMTGPVGLAGSGHARLNWLSRLGPGAALLRLAGTTLGRRRFLADQLADPAADPEAAEILVEALRTARHFHCNARWNRPKSLEGLRDLRCPVTVLWGDKDGVLPVTRAEEFMTYLPPHARLQIVEGAGHALPLERPDLVAQAIVELA